MKTTQVFCMVIMLVFTACTDAPKQPLSESEKNVLVSEVDTTINSMIDGMKKLDMEQAFTSNFLENDEFKYVDIRGKIMNFDEFFKAANDIFNSAKKVDLFFSYRDIRIVASDVALVTLVYNGKYYFESSSMTFPDCGCTLVLNKIDGVWKIIHFHESIQESQFVQTQF